MNKLQQLLFCVTIIPYLHAYADTQQSSCACNKLSKAAVLLARPNHPIPEDMVKIPAGTFMMGAHEANAKADELPLHRVTLDSFLMDKTEVTNAAFAAFVQKTGYITTAEKPVDWAELKKQLPSDTPKPDDTLLAPGSLVFTPPTHPIGLSDPTRWWSWVNGANWRHPLGGSTQPFGEQHPVVHVSWEDANHYCQAMGKRLPTEAEREWAARGGLIDQIYPWGNEALNQGQPKANTWEGHFPDHNTQSDGYYWTSPVTAFPANAYGLYDMAGNVWEWTADLYDSRYYERSQRQGDVVNPQGSTTFDDPEEPGVKKYVLRGGSFLCSPDYCTGYRVSSRMKTAPDTSLVNVGFRCVKSLT